MFRDSKYEQQSMARTTLQIRRETTATPPLPFCLHAQQLKLRPKPRVAENVYLNYPTKLKIRTHSSPKHNTVSEFLLAL